MKTTKITTLAAGIVAVAALALTGCSYPGDDEDRAAYQAGADAPQPPATSAPSEEPDAPSTEAESPADGDEGTEEDSSQDKEKSETADLKVEDGQVQYLRTIQNFSPTMERWVVDEDAGEVTYSMVNCLGHEESAGVATLEPLDDTEWEATWIGDSPVPNLAAESIRLEITENTLTNFSDVASSRTEIESSNFNQMCVDAGETAADFVF